VSRPGSEFRRQQRSALLKEVFLWPRRKINADKVAKLLYMLTPYLGLSGLLLAHILNVN
jgi:hypothetical protein